ncbi:MAG: hypothetical protein ACOZNI_06990 [Myxococcota bacterium]
MLVLIACADPPATPSPASPAAATLPPEPVVRALKGRQVAGLIALPSLPDDHLGRDCAAVNTRLHAKGPPCSVEVWATEGGDARWFWRAGKKAGVSLAADGEIARATLRWPRLGQILEGCLDDDPLALPPAGDPGGTRAWVDDAWILTLTGENPCGLGGQLSLEVTSERAEWRRLLVDGVPWEQGGRAIADGRQLERAVAGVRARWETMDAREREQAIVSLARDPRTVAVAQELSKRRRE